MLGFVRKIKKGEVHFFGTLYYLQRNMLIWEMLRRNKEREPFLRIILIHYSMHWG